MTTDTTPIKVFYSYSHKDKRLRDKLETHLSALQRKGVIQEWHDGCISPGQEWKTMIYQQLAAADLVLLLISPDFIQSEFCYSIEMKQALERHEVSLAQVIPIILRHTDWETAPFSKLQCLPAGGKPVTEWHPQDKAFLDIAKGIREATTKLRRSTGTSAVGTPSASLSPKPELREAYLRLMVDEWNTLRLQVLDPQAADTRARPVALEQVYVSLNTTAPRPKSLYVKDRPDYDQPPLAAVEALCQAPQGRMVLLGQPGSGKSTFSRYLALSLAEALLNPGAVSLVERLPGWTGPARLPVIIALGRLAAGLTEESAEAVASSLRVQVEGWPDLMGYGQALLTELRLPGGLVIFDGLDEVPANRRAAVKAALGRFAAVYSSCWVLVTCRTHSYQQDPGWRLAWPAEYELAPFSDTQVETFITAWYNALSQRDSGAATGYQRKATTLKAALAPNDPRGLRELARTPLLLTVMAIVHTHKELPGSRVAVYRECVDILLLRWQRARAEEGGRQGLLEALAAYDVTERQLEQGLCEVAYRAHEAGESGRLGGSGRALMSGDTLRGVLYRFLKSDAAVSEFIDYCQHANGLLLAQGAVPTSADGPPEPVYAFPHLSFEEYLAARHLRRLKVQGGFTREAAKLAGEPAWREVIRFLGEYLCHDRDGDIDLAQTLLARLCPERTPNDDKDWRRAWLAGELLPALRQEAAAEELDQTMEQRVVERSVALLQNSAALRDAPLDRAAVGRALARVGDPRPGVRLKTADVPDLLWIQIPGTATVQASGWVPNFTGLRLGNGAKLDPEARGDENWPQNAKPLEIVDFELAVYPLTVAQFRPFVAQGFCEDRWWSEAGRCDRGDRTQPYLWDDPVWTLDNHPVVGVTWYDAEAFCNWLNEQLHLPSGTIRLPTEAEWEWAARGPEGRRYPWGGEWESWRCNSEESGISRTSAVGCFPGGAEDYWWKGILPNSGAVHDLVGNVWEWTASEYSEDYSKAGQSVLGDNPEGPCVVRGGSWLLGPRGVRGAARYGGSPRAGLPDGGFRLAGTLTL